jgi:hypothetical protein
MSDFETIDSTALELVNGGALPIKPIITAAEKGVELAEKGYKAVKPYVKKAYDALNIGTTIGTAGQLIHDGWNYMFGPKQPPQQPAPAPQAQGGHS